MRRVAGFSSLNQKIKQEEKMRKGLISVLIGVMLIMGMSVMGVAAKTEQPLVSNVWDETDIIDVLVDIADQTNAKILADDTVTGYITLELKDVPLERALQMVLAPGGFTFRLMPEGYYIVGSADPDNPTFQKLTGTEVVVLNYVKADVVSRLLSDFFRPFVKVDRDRNLVLITGSPETIERVKKDIAKFDVKGKQVEVQLLITEVSEKSFREFGFGNLEVTWGDGLEKLGEIFSVSIGPVTIGATSQNDLRSALTLRVLSERGEAKITGSPKIRVLEGHEAYIKLGEERHIIPVIGIEKGTGTGFTTYVEKEEVKAESGLTVNVNRVTADNEIIFDLQMNLEEILGSIRRTHTGEIFRINKRSAGTTLILENYETMKVGSMTVEREKSLRRFPPYASGEKELVRLDLYMTANVVGTSPPPEYEGLEKFAEGLSWNVEPVEKKKGFIARHPFISALIAYGIYELVSD